MAINSNTFLDFYDIIVNQLIGSPVLFLVIVGIVIMFFATKFNLNNGTVLTLLALFFISITAFTSGMLLAVIVFLAFFFVGILYSKFMQRG